MNQLIKWSFVNLFGMITYQAVFRVTQTTSKHLPDTLRHLPDNPKSINVGIVRGSGRNFLSLLGKAVVEYNDIISFQTAIPLLQSWQYPGSIRHHPETLQTPPYTIQSPQYSASNKTFASQSNLFRCFLIRFLFSQWPWIGHWVHEFGVSVGFLEDVCEVS